MLTSSRSTTLSFVRFSKNGLFSFSHLARYFVWWYKRTRQELHLRLCQSWRRLWQVAEHGEPHHLWRDDHLELFLNFLLTKLLIIETQSQWTCWQSFKIFRYIGITAFPLEEFHKVHFFAILKGYFYDCFFRCWTWPKQKWTRFWRTPRISLSTPAFRWKQTFLVYIRSIGGDFLRMSLFQDHLPYFQSKKLGVINASPTGLNSFLKTMRWGEGGGGLLLW